MDGYAYKSVYFGVHAIFGYLVIFGSWITKESSPPNDHLRNFYKHMSLGNHQALIIILIILILILIISCCDKI
jgi:hypothetical protein